MAITVTIGGVSKDILNASLQINDNINDRSTCRFSIITTDTYSIGQEVIVTDTGTRTFGGTIDNFRIRLLRSTTQKEYDIECIDFNQYADRKRAIQTYESQTAQYIFNDLVTQYLASEGVSMGTYPTTTPTLSKANFNYISVAEAFQYIQQATGLNWNIDYNKNLNIFYREDNVDTGFTDALGNVLEIEVDESREQYRNAQYVKCGDGTTATQTLAKPTPDPDGVSKTFVLRYPVAKKPSIFIDSVQVDAGDIGINGLDTGKKWYWNKGSTEITQDDSETILTTETLEITYQGLIGILVALDNTVEQSDRATIEGGTGIYEGFEKRLGIDDKAEAISYATGILDRFDEIPQRLTIITKEFKQAGKIVPVSISALGINDNYLIENVSITEDSGLVLYEITLLSGQSFGSWVEFFRKITLSAEDVVVQENEVVLQVRKFTENRTRSGNTNIKTYAALFPADDLYPSDTLYPNSNVVTEVNISG